MGQIKNNKFLILLTQLKSKYLLVSIKAQQTCTVIKQFIGLDFWLLLLKILNNELRILKKKKKKKNNNNIESSKPYFTTVGMQYDKILKISLLEPVTHSFLVTEEILGYVYDADNSFGSAPRKLRPSLSTMNLRARHIFHWPSDKNTLTWEQASSSLEILLSVARSNWNERSTNSDTTQIILKSAIRECNLCEDRKKWSK